MKEVLIANNMDLSRQVNTLLEEIGTRSYHSAILNYRDWIIRFLNTALKRIEDNFYYLEVDDPSILSEILDRTKALTLDLRILNSKYVAPLIRSTDSDDLSLGLLKWLHDQHQQSQEHPFAISDGEFAIAPSLTIPIIYYLPASSKISLLHLPLFFHEFGHFLFNKHRPEMSALIAQMQLELEELLTDPFQQNDDRSHAEKERKKNIVETWFDWMEELFCDLVGLTIGGAAFLYTFSLYLRMDGRSAFYLREQELQGSSHPIPDIRIKFLIHYARQMGLEKEASQVETQWSDMAELLNIGKPIYHGYYATGYNVIINQALQDMLTEAAPISFADFIPKSADEKEGRFQNFIHLLNAAWKVHMQNPAAYTDWQKNVLNKYRLNVSSFFLSEAEISVSR